LNTANIDDKTVMSWGAILAYRDSWMIGRKVELASGKSIQLRGLKL